MRNQDLDSNHLMAYWDFEGDPDTDGALWSKGVLPGIKAYAIYRQLNAEDMFHFEDNVSVKKRVNFALGVPLFPNTAFSSPSWIIEGEGNELKGLAQQGGVGEAALTYSAAGKYSVKVKVENDYGESPEKEIIIVVTDPVGIDEENIAQVYEAFPNPFYNTVNVRFVNPGLYTVKIFNTAGALIQQKEYDVDSNLTMPIAIDGESGTYFIQIVHQEKIVQALKVIKQ